MFIFGFSARIIVNDRLSNQSSVKRTVRISTSSVISYKRPGPNKRPVKFGPWALILTKGKEEFCDRFWKEFCKKFCDFFEKCTCLTFLLLFFYLLIFFDKQVPMSGQDLVFLNKYPGHLIVHLRYCNICRKIYYRIEN